jgi:hypothetical protein
MIQKRRVDTDNAVEINLSYIPAKGTDKRAGMNLRLVPFFDNTSNRIPWP